MLKAKFILALVKMGKTTSFGIRALSTLLHLWCETALQPRRKNNRDFRTREQEGQVGGGEGTTVGPRTPAEGKTRSLTPAVGVKN